MNILYTVLGLLTYHLVIMSEQSQNGHPINPITFLKARPYKALLSVIFAGISHTLIMVFLAPESRPEALISTLLGYIDIQINLTPSVVSGIHIAALFLSGFLPYWSFDRWGRKRMLE